ncbi:MAG: hypothetical protein KAH33_00470, partial [Candidatus Delongbacteria bacterium]|nr:hypothetical protein [Candidatus Delongbacteria bacterium]
DVVFSKQPTTFYFESDGTITADSLGTAMGGGTWVMTGNGIRINDSETDFYLLGIVEDNEMDGTVGMTDTWEAERVIPEVLIPNGGEVWMHTTQDTIKWDDSVVGNVVISLADHTGIIQEIATEAGDLGFYVWTVPASIEPRADYRIRVAKEINGDAYGQSAWFCISNTVDMSSDILGEWQISDWWDVYIIEFLADKTWTNSYGSTGTWELLGNGLRWDYDLGSNYSIGNIGTDKMAGTDATWWWYGQRLLDVTYPNGGEIFELGDIVNITWDDNLTAERVDIDLYENEVLLQSIVANTINDNDYSWTIPNDLALSARYNIMITSATSDIYDGCDAYFSINGVPPAVTEIEYDNFEDGLAQNWSAVNGTWAVVDSIYIGTLGAEIVASAVFNTAMTGNYVFETKVRESNVYGGLIMNGDHSSLDGAGDWDNGAVFMINADQYYFWVFEDGINTYNITNISAEILTGASEWNTLKAIVNNDNGDYHLFINDAYIGSVNDTTFNGGELGLHMAMGATAEFDYVNIGTFDNKSTLDNIDIKYLTKENSISNVGYK